MIWTVSNGKGGVGKTAVAAELAYLLAQRGDRVLAVDLDEQATLTTRLGGSRTATATAADVLGGRVSVSDAAQATGTGGISVLVGSPELRTLSGTRPELTTTMRAILAREVGEGRTWTAVVIDTPPSLDVLTVGALAAADQLIVPCTPEVEALEQAGRLARLVDERVTLIRPEARITAVLPIQFHMRRLLDRDVLTELRARFGAAVTEPIGASVVVRESFAERQPVGAYAPRARVTEQLDAALTTIIEGTH